MPKHNSRAFDLYLPPPQATIHHAVSSDGANALCPQREASQLSCSSSNVNCCCHGKAISITYWSVCAYVLACGYRGTWACACT
jgi:hypothetical protein